MGTIKVDKLVYMNRDFISQIEVADGVTFENDNFAQKEPFTDISKRFKNCTFIKTNLLNCDIPELEKENKLDTCQIGQLKRVQKEGKWVFEQYDPRTRKHIQDIVDETGDR